MGSRRCASVWLLLMLLAALASRPTIAQGNGAITGAVRVIVPHKAPLAASVYGRRGVAPKPSAPAADTRSVVVYIDGLPGPSAPAPVRARLVQRGERFEPPVAVVTVGSRVEFPNEDPFFHNVFSLSKAARFDLGSYASGDSRTQVFLRRGVVKVFCRLHAQMSGLVMVLDHPWYAVPNEAGEFGMPAVPAGDHVLVAWHERIGERRERVRVAAGATAQVTFALPMTEDPR